VNGWRRHCASKAPKKQLFRAQPDYRATQSNSKTHPTPTTKIHVVDITTSLLYNKIVANTNVTKLRQKQNKPIVTTTGIQQSPITVPNSLPKTYLSYHSRHKQHERCARKQNSHHKSKKNTHIEVPQNRNTVSTDPRPDKLTISPGNTTASNTLTQYPFPPKQPLTMTFLNNVPAITKRHHITALPSSTLSAIANAVSAKAKLSSSDRSNDYQMPIRRNKGNPNNLLLIPTTILPSTTADDMTNTHTTKLCIPITVRIPNPNPSRNSKFNHSRIIEALLQAFKHVDLESSICPTPTSPHHMNREKIFTT
jgi:hypothetical protein